ncbi:hypothetical protein PR202_ga17872 [Eleusine coracana subsp. coracana]|uniref:Uncharacterized protein n=1 Tax=Eleusine coracana subsp. coracana TaxID=191504 RepID=A0AAV5CRF8_ELECO|nr:hypothetical protein PR202_ga17872 [Eleusine coracana subsp. coracana]
MAAIGSSSPAMDPTAGSAERSYDSVDPAQVLGTLKGVSRVLSRLPCALVPAGGSSGTAGSSRRGASCNPEGLAEIGVGGSAGLGLACHALDSSGRVLIRVGDGRPVSITKVELHAENLRTFVYHGERLPIDLGQAKHLETADLRLYGFTFEYVLSVLPGALDVVPSRIPDV